MRISDWSSDVCSSDLFAQPLDHGEQRIVGGDRRVDPQPPARQAHDRHPRRKRHRRGPIVHADFGAVAGPDLLAEHFRDVDRRIGEEAGYERKGIDAWARFQFGGTFWAMVTMYALRWGGV